MKKKMFMAAVAVWGALLLSCATYDVGVGFEGRSQKLSASGVDYSLTDNNASLRLAGSNEYSDFQVGFHKGTIEAAAGGAKATLDASGISLGTYFKLPFVINQFVTPMALAGVEYHWFTDNNAGSLWKLDNAGAYFGDFVFKLGGGVDVSFSKSFFVRSRLLYAPPILSSLSDFTFTLGLGYRTDEDKEKNKWKTKETRTIEMVNKQGQEALDKKDWTRAIALYTSGIAVGKDNYTYYYKRSEAHAGAGDYAAALDDFNRATRINPLLQGSTGYETWKRLVAGYEKEAGEDAPMDGQGKVIVLLSALKIADRNAPAPWKGSGNGVSYPEGQHTFTFWFDNGTDKSREAAITFPVEAGRVYLAGAARDNNTVTITVVDATERELRGGGETKQIASRSVEIIVLPLPSGLELPSWVKNGLSERQVRARMGRAPDQRRGNIYGYMTTGGTVVMFEADESGLNEYTVAIDGNRSTLATVVNHFKKVTGMEPVVNEDGINMWAVPLKVREDILLLRAWYNDGSVYVSYYFPFEED